MKRRIVQTILLLVVVLAAFSCKPQDVKIKAPFSVAVFIPGVVSGSPVYEMLVSGAQRAVAAVPGTELKVIEGDFNQAEWPDKLAAIAASGKFNLIVSSNPAMPELCARIAKDYPKVRFFIADGYLMGNPSIHTVLYNQLEQGYLVGYLTGLQVVAQAKTGASLKAGLVIAQNYPTLDRLIQPGFLAGLKEVDGGISLETRLIGSWSDATKAAELARSLYDSGVPVILPIAGGAGQGVIAAAREKRKFVVWFDASGYGLGSEIIGCAVLRQDKLVEQRLLFLLSGDQSLYGKADIVGIKEGYVDFDFDGDGYRALPPELRAKMETAVTALKNGKPSFTLDSF